MGMELVCKKVDRTLKDLERKIPKFGGDPVIPFENALISYVVGSLQKRHGSILESALWEALRASNRVQVWREKKFKISQQARNTVENLLSSKSIDEAYNAASETFVRYGEEASTVQVDGIVDNADLAIRAYEVKRANSWNDTGKIEQTQRDMLCVQVLLKSYAEQVRELRPKIAESKIIFYYGVRKIPPPWSLVKEELDQHFGFPMIALVEEVNTYFSDKAQLLFEKLAKGELHK